MVLSCIPNTLDNATDIHSTTKYTICEADAAVVYERAHINLSLPSASNTIAFINSTFEHTHACPSSASTSNMIASNNPPCKNSNECLNMGDILLHMRPVQPVELMRQYYLHNCCQQNFQNTVLIENDVAEVVLPTISWGREDGGLHIRVLVWFELLLFVGMSSLTYASIFALLLQPPFSTWVLT